MPPEGALDEQPHRRCGVPLLAQHDPFARKFVGDRAFGPLRYGTAIPERRGNRVGQRRHGTRRRVGHRDPRGMWLPLPIIGICLRRGRERLGPTPRGGHEMCTLDSRHMLGHVLARCCRCAHVVWSNLGYIIDGIRDEEAVNFGSCLPAFNNEGMCTSL